MAGSVTYGVGAAPCLSFSKVLYAVTSSSLCCHPLESMSWGAHFVEICFADCVFLFCHLCVICQEKLGLGSTGLSDADLKELGENIRPSNSLKILGLSSNELTRGGVEAFFKALQRQRGKPQHPLHTLILTRNRFEVLSLPPPLPPSLPPPPSPSLSRSLSLSLSSRARSLSLTLSLSRARSLSHKQQPYSADTHIVDNGV